MKSKQKKEKRQEEYQKTVEFDRLPVGMNNAYKQTRDGRRFLSREAKDWKEEIGWAFKREPDKRNYGVEIFVEMADNRIRDVDSGNKFILDALSGIIYFNDNQVLEVHLYKSRGHEEHKTIISVWSLD